MTAQVAREAYGSALNRGHSAVLAALLCMAKCACAVGSDLNVDRRSASCCGRRAPPSADSYDISPIQDGSEATQLVFALKAEPQACIRQRQSVISSRLSCDVRHLGPASFADPLHLPR